MGSTEPDDLDDERPADEVVRLLMGPGRDPDEGGAVMMVAAPHKPAPHDSAIALPLPVEDERD